MNIAVILKQVPDTEARVVVDSADSTRIVEEDIKFILNPYDEFAVEEAIQITDRLGGEITGVCIGPDRSETAIRTAMAMGIHRAILITDPEAVNADVITQSRILAQIIRNLDVSLVLCGREVIDTQEDAIAAAVAQFLDIPHVLNASKIDVGEGSVHVEREIEGGVLEIETELPAVISCQKGLNEPRYPTLIAIKRSKRKELKKPSLDDYNIRLDAMKSRVSALSFPPERGEGKIVSGEPADMVAEAVKWLSEEAKVI